MAVFYELPHSVVGHVGKVVTNNKDKFFQKEHSPIPYYIAGLLSAKWEKLSSMNETLKSFNKYRYHIFMGTRYLIEDLQFHPTYLKTIKNYSVKTSDNKRTNSYEKLLFLFNNAIELFKQLDYKRPRGAYSGPITQEFIRKLQEFINKDINDSTDQ